MECQASDSKKLFKVFDASSRRKRSRKAKDGFDDSISLATDDSNTGRASVGLVTSAKGSMQDLAAMQSDAPPDASSSKSSVTHRDRESSPSPARESVRSGRSPRRHRRHQWMIKTTDLTKRRDLISLALKPGHVSTPRSVSPSQERHGITDILSQDQDSYVYAFLEDAIKRDLRRQRREGRSRERERSACRTHHHHRRRRDETETGPREKVKAKQAPAVDQAALLQTFAQICAQMTKKNNAEKEIKRSLSHKSLQCEVIKGDTYEVDHQPTRLLHQDHSYDNIPSSRVRSYENLPDRGRHRSHLCVPPIAVDDRRERSYVYDKVGSRYASKVDLDTPRMQDVRDERCRDYRRDAMPTRSRLDQSYRQDETLTRNRLDQGYRPEAKPTRSRLDQCYRRRTPDRRELHDYDRTPTRHDERDRRYIEQKTSRSFDVHRDPRPDGYDDDRCRRSTRSETTKKRFEDQDKRYDDRKEKYYEDRPLERDSRARHFGNLPSKDRRSRRNLDRLERNSVASREEYYRERDRNSERERDSGLSIADGENSTVSGKSNYLRVVKQEIAEQREAMDKMMKLWKELMRCFKSMSQTQGQNDKNIHESAANVQESAAAQLRLWRECMRRYETVARDVGDTDARLMEEINKQRSEMAEMSTMWQECLQRYRDMSNDFNSLKERIASSNSPTRPPAPPLMHAEGEAVAPPPNYRLPTYPPPMPAMGGGYGPGGGSPIRSHLSAPPAWWWCPEQQPHPKPARRRSSPESRGSRGSRGSRERRRRHKERERDDTRYKEKTAKAGGARSEHRHRKR